MIRMSPRVIGMTSGKACTGVCKFIGQYRSSIWPLKKRTEMKIGRTWILSPSLIKLGEMQNDSEGFAECKGFWNQHKGNQLVGKKQVRNRQFNGIPIAQDSSSGIISNYSGFYIPNSYIGKNKEDALMKEGIKVKVIKKSEIKPQTKAVAAKSKRAS